MLSVDVQGTAVPRLGTTAWPPGLLLPVGDWWPPDFAVRELLEVDCLDADQVRTFLVAWGVAGGPDGEYGGEYDDLDAELNDAMSDWRADRPVPVRPRVSMLDVIEVPWAQQVSQTVLAVLTASRDGLDDETVRDDLFEPFFEKYLQWAHPRVALNGFETPPRPVIWLEAVAGQLFNYVSQGAGWQRCANEPAHPGGRGAWFTVQRTDRRSTSGYGPQDASRRTRFCSRQCARAHTERERRRRRREQREASKA